MNINADFAAAAGGKAFPLSLGTFFLNPCFHAVALFRFSALLYRAHLEPLAKVVWCVNRMLYHVDLDYKARLAPGFRLVHGLGVVIGAGVVSDGPLTVYQGVTIGGSYGRHREDGRGGLLAAPFRERRHRIHEFLRFRSDIHRGRRNCEGGPDSHEGRRAGREEIIGGRLCRLSA